MDALARPRRLGPGRRLTRGQPRLAGFGAARRGDPKRRRPSFAGPSAAALTTSGSTTTWHSASRSWLGGTRRSASTWRAASRPEVAHELAHALDYNGEPDEAIAVFQELTRIRPGSGRHLRCLGLALRKRGRVHEADTAIDAAIAVLREEIRQRPEDPWPRRNLGWTLSDRGKHQEAVAELRKAARDHA